MPKTIESDMFRLFCRFRRTVVVDGWTFSMNTYNKMLDMLVVLMPSHSPIAYNS